MAHFWDLFSTMILFFLGKFYFLLCKPIYFSLTVFIYNTIISSWTLKHFIFEKKIENQMKEAGDVSQLVVKQTWFL